MTPPSHQKPGWPICGLGPGVVEGGEKKLGRFLANSSMTIFLPQVLDHRADSAFQVDGAKKELFGTHAKVYGFRPRRSSDVRTSVCVRRCDSANFIVEN